MGLLLLGVTLSPVLEACSSRMSSRMWPHTNRSNRVLSVYGSMASQPARSLDMRLYNQQSVIGLALEKNALYAKGSSAIRIKCWDCAVFQVASKAVSGLLTSLIYVFVCMKAWAGAFGIGSVTQYVIAITQLCGGFSRLLGMSAS